MRLDWQVDANCRGVPVDLFYGPQDEEGDDIKLVETYCKTCPVRKECLRHGLRYELHGVWGGKTAMQRRRIRSRLQISVEEPQIGFLRDERQHGTQSGYNRHLRRIQAGLEAGPITCEPCRVANNLSKWEARRKKEGK